MEKKSKIDIHDSESTSSSVAVRSGAAAADALIICASHSPRKNKHPTESVGGERSLLCQGENQGIEVHIVKQCFMWYGKGQQRVRDDFNARERVCIPIDDESRRADRVAAHRGRDRSALSKQNALAEGHNDTQKVSVRKRYVLSLHCGRQRFIQRQHLCPSRNAASSYFKESIVSMGIDRPTGATANYVPT